VDDLRCFIVPVEHVEVVEIPACMEVVTAYNLTRIGMKMENIE
jgi:hypothetical protein